jgi:short-subunit dehydrogenase
MEWRDRTVVLTGASSGIGRQTALDLAARGASLVLAARRADRLAEVAAGCGGAVELVAGDVATEGFVEYLVARALDRFGRLDVVVNNAGVPKHKQIFDLTAEDVEYTLRVNLVAPARLVVAALPAMLRQGEGWIVNVSSIAGKLPPPREAIYAASKFGLTGFTEGLWLDLGGSNVHASVIHVGPVDTEIWAKTDEPAAYRGRKLPPAVVSAAIVRAVEQRLPEVWVPRRLKLAWWLRVFAPRLFRAGMERFDPVSPAVVAAARARVATPGASR